MPNEINHDGKNVSKTKYFFCKECFASSSTYRLSKLFSTTQITNTEKDESNINVINVRLYKRLSRQSSVCAIGIIFSHPSNK